jgi:hypothetical protein
LLCITIVKAQQTHTITGIVTDEQDAPIPGATVFLGDSRKATVSDSEGRFVLAQVQPGNYNLVVKMIGYVVLRHSFILQNKDIRFRFKLQEDNVLLNTVEISAMSWAERKRHLATFIRCFLGTSTNASQCKILNTDDIKLRFDKKNNVLTASSNEFLIIENKALGYRMKYLLNNFSYERPYLDGGIISFAGTLFFADLKGSERQQKRWEQQRANTYLGSVPHFFRSLFNNTLEEQGFITYIIPNRTTLSKMLIKDSRLILKYLNPVKSFSRYLTTVDENFKTFNVGLLSKDSTEVYVLYTRATEPAEFGERGAVVYRSFKMPSGQLSVIRPTGDSISISRSGDISPVNGILMIGFWTWGQMSSFLPSDYTIPAALEPKNLKVEVPNAAAATGK